MNLLVDNPDIDRLKKLFVNDPDKVETMEKELAAALDSGETVLESIEALVGQKAYNETTSDWIDRSRVGCAKARMCILLLSSWENLFDDEMAKAERLPVVDGFINDCLTEDKHFPAVMVQHLRAWGSGRSVQDIFGKKEAKKGKGKGKK